jgi:hypothetical protein
LTRGSAFPGAVRVLERMDEVVGALASGTEDLTLSARE